MIQSFGSYTYSESQSYADSIQKLKNALHKIDAPIQPFKSSDEKTASLALSKLSFHENYDKVTLLHGIKLNSFHHNSSLIVLTFNSHSHSTSSRKIHTIKHVEIELVGLTSFKQDIGHVIIRPETLTDKLVELLSPVEVDFDFNKTFSKKYYVLASDEKLLRKNIDPKILSIFEKYDDLFIEIKNKRVLLRLLKPINEENTLKLYQVLKEINRLYTESVE